MRPALLVHLYRRRLRVHKLQELLAGVGVAVAVALLFAVTVANDSIAGSTAGVVHAVAGPATLQLRARSGDGFNERLLARVEALPGVSQAAPMLEQTATVLGPHGREATVQIAGADLSLALLDGLAHTIPLNAFSADGIGLSQLTAEAIRIPAHPAHTFASAEAQAGGVQSGGGQTATVAQTSGTQAGDGTQAGGTQTVALELRGRRIDLPVTAVLNGATFGALAHAPVAVMPLAHLQALAGLPGQISRILVVAKPGRTAAVRGELSALAGPAGLAVAPADQDIGLLAQALRPNSQASEFFAAISALLGFLFAFNAILLTVPERRHAIADLRLLGMRGAQVVQMVLFQAICLGLGASLVGLLAGYALAVGPFHQSPGYLAEAFVLGTSTVVGVGAVLLALGGGVLATCLASVLALLDLRGGGRALDAPQDGAAGVPGDALGRRTQLRLVLAVAGLLAFVSVAFALWPTLSLLAVMLLGLVCVLAVPLALGLAMHGAGALAGRYQQLTVLPVALLSLRGSTTRSLALAATGAVALFGSGALGGARNDLLAGLRGFARSYSADADIWVATPGDYSATVDFQPGEDAARIARIPGVSAVHAFYGSYFNFDGRRIWIVGRPPGTEREVLRGQIVDGSVDTTVARLAAGGQITLSRQIASERRLGVGGFLTLPTPGGQARLRVAAITTNVGWSPGTILMDAADYRRYWPDATPTALGVELVPGANATRVARAVVRALGPASGLEVSTAPAHAGKLDKIAAEGLGQLQEIETLLTLAAILALAAALTSAIWQRRVALAELRLAGVAPARLQRVLLLEAALLLGAGCLTGILVGVYGQVLDDSYLEHVAGYPLVALTAGGRPFELLALVMAIVLAIVAVPGFLAARVPPTLALEE